MSWAPVGKAYLFEEKDRIENLAHGSDHEHVVCHEQNVASVIFLKRPLSMRELFSLFSMSFSYALCFNTLGNLVIPRTVTRLTETRQSLWVGTLMTLGAFCQMSAPLIGAYSDRVGSRIIFLLYGSVLTAVGIFLFILVEITDMLMFLYVAQVTCMAGLSIVYSMTTALLNDYVLEEQMGKGSGAMAVLALLGSGTGYGMFALDVPIIYSLCFYVLATLFCFIITTSAIPTMEPARPLAHSVRLCDMMAAAFIIPSFRVFPDFIFSCVGRALFNCGLAVQVYLVFFLRDVLELYNPMHVASVLSIAALLGGLVTAIPSGILSDLVGRKPVIYVSVGVCAGSLIMLLMVRDVALLYVVGFIYGAGTASYLSVDYALGVSTLPRKCGIPIDAAKDLGLFATSATIGTLIGQIIYGTALQVFVGKTEAGASRYNSLGFVVVYSVSSLAFVASGAAVAFIRVK